MRVVVGLGNPGPEYAATRHNVGWRCVDLLARRASIALNERRRLAVVGSGRIAGQEVVLAKPRTYVNASGEAVAYLLNRFHAAPADLVVIYDDMDLPVGKIRVRPSGSAAGHKGMLSIVAALATQEFARVRIGIGRPASNGETIDFVLGRFHESERPLADEAIARAADAVELLLAEGTAAAMNRFN